MENPPTTKADVIERNRASRAAWEVLIGGLSEEQMVAPEAVGGWSIRDIVAHIAADDRWFAAQLEAAQRGEPPTATECYGTEDEPGPEFDFATSGGRNAWHLERSRGVPLAEVRSKARVAADRRDALLAALPEAEYLVRYTIADLRHVGWVRRAVEGEPGSPLWSWIQGNSWHHYEDHAGAVRAALGQSD